MLAEVRESCEAALRELGADSFWYWGIGALVFAGEDTLRSVSGRDYRVADRAIADDDIVSIDLSPRRRGVWGDFARTLIVQDGRLLLDVRACRNPEWSAGIEAEQVLHDALLAVAEPSMTFEELHGRMNERVTELGYENLDFLGNLGHSIEQRSEDRIYIEQGNTARLDSVSCFTFEPHIRRIGGGYGYKHENIYCFEAGKLREL